MKCGIKQLESKGNRRKCWRKSKYESVERDTSKETIVGGEIQRSKNSCVTFGHTYAVGGVPAQRCSPHAYAI